MLLQSGGEGLFSVSGGASEGFVVVTGELDYDSGPKVYALNVTARVSKNKTNKETKKGSLMVWSIKQFS